MNKYETRLEAYILPKDAAKAFQKIAEREEKELKH
ncbi:hypothetical protein V070_01138 [Staphylococcus aureus C0673]|nr:hypothetical protein V070_01138 [Staphylococcus aureus C0673]